MNHYRVDADKMLDLLRLIHTGDYSTSEMATILSVSTRTISRMMKVLEDVFHVIITWEWTVGRQRVIYHVDDYGLFDKALFS